MFLKSQLFNFINYCYQHESAPPQMWHDLQHIKEFKKEDGKSKTFDAKHWTLKGSLCRRGKRHNVIFRASFSFGNWLLAVDLLSPSSVEL